MGRPLRRFIPEGMRDAYSLGYRSGVLGNTIDQEMVRSKRFLELGKELREKLRIRDENFGLVGDFF